MVESRGPYRAYLELEGHAFLGEVSPSRSGVRVIKTVPPPWCRMAKPGDPLYERARSILGRYFRERRADLAVPKPRRRLDRRQPGPPPAFEFPLQIELL